MFITFSKKNSLKGNVHGDIAPSFVYFERVVGSPTARLLVVDHLKPKALVTVCFLIILKRNFYDNYVKYNKSLNKMAVLSTYWSMTQSLMLE